MDQIKKVQNADHMVRAEINGAVARLLFPMSFLLVSGAVLMTLLPFN